MIDYTKVKKSNNMVLTFTMAYMNTGKKCLLETYC